MFDYYSYLYQINIFYCLYRYENGHVLLKAGFSLDQIKKKENNKLNRSLYSEFYDIKLRSEDGVIIEAHKCVLAARLHYFQSMFMCGWVEVNKIWNSIKQ